MLSMLKCEIWKLKRRSLSNANCTLHLLDNCKVGIRRQYSRFDTLSNCPTNVNMAITGPWWRLSTIDHGCYFTINIYTKITVHFSDFSLSLTAITHEITVNLDETASVHLNISTSDTVTVTAYKSNNVARVIEQKIVTKSQTEVTFNIGPIGDSDTGKYTFIAKPDPSNAYDQRVEVEIKIKDPARTAKTNDGYLLESFLTAVTGQHTAKNICNGRNGWLVNIKK
ncbi:uncharacterized protein LOC144431234 [Styela clava]